MLYIARISTKEILFKVDAWDINCEAKAVEFLNANKLNCVKDVVTAMGDRILWVD